MNNTRHFRAAHLRMNPNIRMPAQRIQHPLIENGADEHEGAMREARGSLAKRLDVEPLGSHCPGVQDSRRTKLGKPRRRGAWLPPFLGRHSVGNDGLRSGRLNAVEDGLRHTDHGTS